MGEFTGTATSLANLLLAVRYPFPLHTSRIYSHEECPLRAALKLATQFQAAQANRMEDIYKRIIRSDYIADALRDNFAPESLCRNLPEQHLLCSLPVLACANPGYEEGKRYLHDTLHAIRDRLGYAFFESAIHACVGHEQVSQEITITRCVNLVCNYFPDDILSLAQRYGDLMIRLHGALPFLTMLHRWCDHQTHVSQEALVEAFNTPLTRAAAMIFYHPKLLPIVSAETVEAAFDALSLAERARLLLHPYPFVNIHASSVERKLRLLDFDTSIQSEVWTSSHGTNMDFDELLVRCLLHIPDPSSVHVVLEQACKQSWHTRYILPQLIDKELCSDEARMSLARVLVNAPSVLHDVGGFSTLMNNTRQFARSLPDAPLRAALEARLEWCEQIYRLSEMCIYNMLELVANCFGARLKHLQDDADIAEVYNAMLQDQAWLEIVDETITNILDAHSLSIMDTMYSISSEPEQGV